MAGWRDKRRVELPIDLVIVHLEVIVEAISVEFCEGENKEQ